jgi:magnesium transporter
MIEYYYKKKEEDKIEKIDNFIKGCWINVVGPTKEEIDFLIEKFELNESNLADGIDIHENPRFEIDEKKVYIYLTCPTNKIKHEYDSSFLIIYSKDFFMTVAKTSLEIFDKILNSKTKFSTFSKSKNMTKILFLISRMFENAVHKILKDTKTNRAELDKLKNKDIEKLITYEDQLNTYIASFGGIINVYSRILRDKSVKFLKKDEEIVEDLIIDLNETLNLCKQTLKTISNMRTYYSTKLSNDLNKTVTLLTLVTIFISIPTLITGFYGMNIDLPLQNNPRIISILGGLTIGIFAVFILILKKKNII